MTITHAADENHTFNGGMGPVQHTTQDLFEILNERMDRMEQQLERIEGMITKADKAIDQIGKEVMPTIEALTDHPLLKALNFGKRVKNV